ncbi:hypothetical protein NDI48_27390 [Microcoleus sp. AS-A8]
MQRSAANQSPFSTSREKVSLTWEWEYRRRECDRSFRAWSYSSDNHAPNRNPAPEEYLR